jgi:hypothetical protein
LFGVFLAAAVFISGNLIAGVEPAAAFSLGWDVACYQPLKWPVRDETGNEIRQIEALVDGMRSKTPSPKERA